MIDLAIFTDIERDTNITEDKEKREIILSNLLQVLSNV